MEYTNFLNLFIYSFFYLINDALFNAHIILMMFYVKKNVSYYYLHVVYKVFFEVFTSW